MRSEYVIKISLPLMLGAAALSCAQQMGTQPSHHPLDGSEMRALVQTSQAPVGTVQSRFGVDGKQIVQYPPVDLKSDTTPFPLTRAVLERGRERFEINCAVCHGLSGYGDGIVVKRGFLRPPSFHDPRLRAAPMAHFFDVMTHGFGAMARYDDQVTFDDRWAIAAYIRALQISQNTSVDQLSSEEVQRLEESK